MASEVGSESMMSPDHRPTVRERVVHSGTDVASDSELLAVVLAHHGQGLVAGTLLQSGDGLLGLAGKSVAELRRLGLRPTAAAQVAAVFELSRRLSRARRRERPSLKTPEAVAEAMGTALAGVGHEELWCLPMDPQSRLIGQPLVVSKGDVDGTDAGPRAFFRLALAAGATSAIAIHNHPGGDPTPSAADRAATRRLAEAGRIVDVPLVDHVVLGTGGRFSSLRRLSPELF